MSYLKEIHWGWHLKCLAEGGAGKGRQVTQNTGNRQNNSFLGNLQRRWGIHGLHLELGSRVPTPVTEWRTNDISPCTIQRPHQNCRQAGHWNTDCLSSPRQRQDSLPKFLFHKKSVRAWQPKTDVTSEPLPRTTPKEPRVSVRVAGKTVIFNWLEASLVCTFYLLR